MQPPPPSRLDEPHPSLGPALGPGDPSRAPLSALDVARRVLVRVEGGAYATLALSGEIERARLDESARGMCTELVYGSLRQLATLDRALAALAPRGLASIDPQVRVLLRLGAYQLLFMRIPPARAVNQVVTALRALRGSGLAGFANALLRRLAREGLPPVPALPADAAPDVVAQTLAALYGLPLFLIEDVLRTHGRPETEALCAALSTPAPTWLRLNPLRGSYAEARAALLAERVELAAIPNNNGDNSGDESRDNSGDESRDLAGLPEAVRLLSGHPFGAAAYGEGWFTAQDLGAQLVARLLLADTEEGPLSLPAGPLLDACCGTGGKATHLAALTAAAGSPRPIDAVDHSPRKLDLCRDHIHRLRCANIRTTALDLLDPAAIAQRLRPSYAAVLLDAPCSGSGVLRRHPEARSRLTQAQVHELTRIQQRMVENLLPQLAVGGVFVYAVCSLLTAEGQAITDGVLRAHPHLRPLPPPGEQAPWRTTYSAARGSLATWPHRHNADSFYAVRWQRTA